MTMQWREIQFPQPLLFSHSLGLMTHLASDRGRGALLFEARVQAGQLRFLYGADTYELGGLALALSRQVPGLVITDVADQRRPVDRAGRVRIRQRSLALRLTSIDQMLRALLGALINARRPDDVLVVQLVLGGGLSPEVVPQRVPDPTQSVWSALLEGVRPAGADVRAQVKLKLDQYRFRADGRIGVAAGASERRQALVGHVLAALRQLESGATRVDLVRERADLLDAGYVAARLPLRLTPSEALAFAAWPVGDGELPGQPSLHPRLIAPPAAYRPPRHRVFATSTAPGVSVPIGIPIGDALQHTHILGPTGTGKSTVMLNLITADIEAERSVVLLDPKRDLAMDVLARIPTHRHNDVVVIDPTMPRPVGLNPLPAPPERQPLVADGLLAIFRGLFPSAFGPRTSDILHASLLTLMRTPGATLVQLPTLLTDASFRRSLTVRIDDPAGLSSFWAQWEAMSIAQQAVAVGPVMSRLRQFLLRPGLRAVLDQAPPKFALGEIFTRPRIVIVSLNKGLLGEQSARLLGSLVVGQLWQLTLARAAMPEAQRAPASVYIDEAQNFLHIGDLAEALEQSRSLHVAWHLAHQHRRQMPADLMAGIDTNARNKIVFGLEGEDAGKTAALTASDGLIAQDFIQLPRYHVYVNLMSGGNRTGWFSGRTMAPATPTSDPLALIASSQARYGAAPTTATAKPASGTLGLPSAPADDEPFGRAPRSRP